MGYEYLPGMSDREMLEKMTPSELVDLVVRHGEAVSDYERIMNLASEVLEGYGTSVEEELDKRERESEWHSHDY